MGFHELKEYASLLNVALVPILLYLRRIETRMAEFGAWMPVHDRSDQRQFDAINARLDRIEEKP